MEMLSNPSATVTTWSNSVQTPRLLPAGLPVAAAVPRCEGQELVPESSEGIWMNRGHDGAGALPRACWQAQGRKEMQRGGAGG